MTTATNPRLNWAAWSEMLRPAADHAAIGDELPRLGRLPAPARWVGRMAARFVYGVSRVLTKRQKAYNLAMLNAVSALAEKVKAIDAGPAPYQTPNEIPVGGPRSFPAVFNQSSWMEFCERVLLYGLVYGVRPKRVLEIGTFQGGSALIIAAALDDIGDGVMVCVDPNPRLPQENLDRISHRASIVAAPSPEALLKAEQVAGGKFDFALIDGDHSYDGVIRDVEGTLPALQPNTYLLFHDAHYDPVRRGINTMLAKYPFELQDCGMMSAHANPDADNPGVLWGGIRVLRYRPAAG
jgi:hypothetical protein